MIADIVKNVGGDKVEVVNVVPPAACPGNFDLKPGDVQKLAEARLFLRHDWQGSMFTKELIESVHNKDLQVVEVAVAGNWMAPPVQKEAVTKFAGVLMEKDPSNRAYYEQNADRLVSQIESLRVGPTVNSSPWSIRQVSPANALTFAPHTFHAPSPCRPHTKTDPAPIRDQF
ncbi:MAG TPA: zinc ABC transporter solute-binding protein [Thermoanaerobacterium sp.]|nr:zinc ABC transporter solute-binding protein [Thermoanaerobacterium sp.]